MTPSKRTKVRFTKLPGREMKVIEENPIIWGYKKGYSVQEIAEGLGIQYYLVEREIERYKDRVARDNEILRKGAVLDDQRMAIWKRQKSGAREALAKIEAEKAMERYTRYGR